APARAALEDGIAIRGGAGRDRRASAKRRGAGSLRAAPGAPESGRASGAVGARRRHWGGPGGAEFRQAGRWSGGARGAGGVGRADSSRGDGLLSAAKRRRALAGGDDRGRGGGARRR